jgi:hypothetical protein
LAPIVLGEDDLHRLLEHRARRTRLGARPNRDLRRVYAEEGGKALAAAADRLALLQDLSAHLGPPRFVLHGRRLVAIFVPEFAATDA